MPWWDDRYGWDEVQLASASTGPDIVAARPGYKHMLRRIHGTSDEDFYVKSSTTTIDFFKSGTIDTPGLEITANEGEALRLSGASTSCTLNFQVASRKVSHDYDNVKTYD
jgi:hypothetical protein